MQIRLQEYVQLHQCITGFEDTLSIGKHEVTDSAMHALSLLSVSTEDITGMLAHSHREGGGILHSQHVTRSRQKHKCIIPLESP